MPPSSLNSRPVVLELMVTDPVGAEHVGSTWAKVGADGAVGTVAIVTVLGVVQAGLAVLLVVMV